MQTDSYDCVIIGAGPSGLYTAYRLEQCWKGPRPLRLLILEKNGYLGGRTRQVRFHSTLVVTGAGVGRYPKDKILWSLVQKISSPTVPSPIRKPLIDYQLETPVSTMKYIDFFRSPSISAWMNQHRSSFSFKEAFLHFFSYLEYQRFCQSNGYTDFEKADMIDTVYDYGFEDNTNRQKTFQVPWNRLMKYLRHSLKHTRILFHTLMERWESVTSSSSSSTSHWIVYTQSNGQTRLFHTNNIIMAGSIERYPVPAIQKGIGYNSFLRLYVFLKHPNSLYSSICYTKNPLQKIIPITSKILLLSYSDNQHAQTVHSMSLSHIATLGGFKPNSILDSRPFFWKKGTHFYYPLNTSLFKTRNEFIRFAQNPQPHLFLVGEVISRNQGWTEGAFQSVEAILSTVLRSL